jgi:Protein of unknown function (DUF4236)
MAWSFRRSVNFGPLRINLSRKGVGLSVGARGFRVGKDAQGRNYTQLSIPGTGIYNRQYFKAGLPQHSSPPSPIPAAPTQQQSSGRQMQFPPSAKYLLLLFGTAGLVWIVFQLFFH